VAHPTIRTILSRPQAVPRKPLTSRKHSISWHLSGAVRPLPDKALSTARALARKRPTTWGDQMTNQSAAAVNTVPAPPARLEPDAIGVAQDTVIGMASSAPADLGVSADNCSRSSTS
jgi:hypothetical protein